MIFDEAAFGFGIKLHPLDVCITVDSTHIEEFCCFLEEKFVSFVTL